MSRDKILRNRERLSSSIRNQNLLGSKLHSFRRSDTLEIETHMIIGQRVYCGLVCRDLACCDLACCVLACCIFVI